MAGLASRRKSVFTCLSASRVSRKTLTPFERDRSKQNAYVLTVRTIGQCVFLLFGNQIAGVATDIEVSDGRTAVSCDDGRHCFHLSNARKVCAQAKFSVTRTTSGIGPDDRETIRLAPTASLVLSGDYAVPTATAYSR